MKVLGSVVALALIVMVGGPAIAQKKHAMPSNGSVKPAPKDKPAVWYDFRGAKLGMTLEEWMALEPPAPAFGISNQETPTRVWCNSDRMPDGEEVTGFPRSDVEIALGVISCRYAHIYTYNKYSVSLLRSYLKFGKYSCDDIDYKFMDGILYKISITCSKSLLEDIVDGLTAKFGGPSSVRNDTTLSREGVKISHMERTWLSSVASIHLEAPYYDINNLNVTYMTVSASNRIALKERELHPEADKM